MILNFTAIDLETSGLKASEDKIIEVAAMRVRDGEIISVFNTIVRFEGELSPDIIKHTGHTQEDVAKGMPPQLVAEVLWHMLQSDDVAGGTELIVAYNACFDMGFLHELFKEHIPGYWEGGDGAFDWHFIDPLTIFRDRKKPYPHRLKHACMHYGVEMGQWHNAYDDTQALVEVVKAMDKEQDIGEYIDIMGYNQKYPLPDWYPQHAILRPQGSVSVTHNPPKGAVSAVSKLRPAKRTPDALNEVKQPEPEPLNNFTKQLLHNLMVGGSKFVNIFNEELPGVMQYLMSKGIPEDMIYADADSPADCDVSIDPKYINPQAVTGDNSPTEILTGEQLKDLDMWINAAFSDDPFARVYAKKYLTYHSQIAQLAAIEYLKTRGFEDFTHYVDNGLYTLDHNTAGNVIDISDDDLPF